MRPPNCHCVNKILNYCYTVPGDLMGWKVMKIADHLTRWSCFSLVNLMMATSHLLEIWMWKCLHMIWTHSTLFWQVVWPLEPSTIDGIIDIFSGVCLKHMLLILFPSQRAVNLHWKVNKKLWTLLYNCMFDLNIWKLLDNRHFSTFYDPIFCFLNLQRVQDLAAPHLHEYKFHNMEFGYGLQP